MESSSRPYRLISIVFVIINAKRYYNLSGTFHSYLHPGRTKLSSPFLQTCELTLLTMSIAFLQIHGQADQASL